MNASIGRRVVASLAASGGAFPEGESATNEPLVGALLYSRRLAHLPAARSAISRPEMSAAPARYQQSCAPRSAKISKPALRDQRLRASGASVHHACVSLLRFVAVLIDDDSRLLTTGVVCHVIDVAQVEADETRARDQKEPVQKFAARYLAVGRMKIINVLNPEEAKSQETFLWAEVSELTDEESPDVAADEDALSNLMLEVRGEEWR